MGRFSVVFIVLEQNVIDNIFNEANKEFRRPQAPLGELVEENSGHETTRLAVFPILNRLQITACSAYHYQIPGLEPPKPPIAKIVKPFNTM
ncbi:hypothetical protein ACCD10_01545 [Pseudomonas sp. Pseusp122]|uniref:hypothetical protein n=1 Tax=unclassified Pseudomonas TaxID=196821 RepID=UPI0039A55B3B